MPSPVVAAIEDGHYQFTKGDKPDDQAAAVCRKDSEPWPCKTIRLARTAQSRLPTPERKLLNTPTFLPPKLGF